MDRDLRVFIRNRFRRMSLVQKFSAATIFLIFTVMVVVNALVITYQKNALKTEVDNNNLVLAKKLASDVIEPLIFMDPLRLDELVRTTAQTPACIYAGVVDRSGRIVAHTNRKLLGQRATGSVQQLSDMSVSKAESSGTISEDGLRVIVIPVKTGYEIVGSVVVGFSGDAVAAAIENNLGGLKKYILLVTLAVMAAGVWGAYVLARVLATPMRKLKDTMELVQEGNLDVEMPVDFPEGCVEILQCEAKECPAYGKVRCWNVPGTLCFGYVQGSVPDKICDCKKCIVYKKACGDEIGELVEGFDDGETGGGHFPGDGPRF